MLSFNEISAIPYIGQLLHFHPDKSTRLAAWVCEVHPSERNTITLDVTRPFVRLKVLNAEGSFSLQDRVPAARLDDPDLTDLTGTWTFPNEFATLQINDSSDEDTSGTKSNIHVGLMNTLH